MENNVKESKKTKPIKFELNPLFGGVKQFNPVTPQFNKFFIQNQTNKFFPADFFEPILPSSSCEIKDNFFKTGCPKRIFVDLQREYDEDKELLDLLEGKPSTSQRPKRKEYLKEVIEEEDEEKTKRNNNEINLLGIKQTKKNHPKNIPISKSNKLIDSPDFTDFKITPRSPPVFDKNLIYSLTAKTPKIKPFDKKENNQNNNLNINNFNSELNTHNTINNGTNNNINKINNINNDNNNILNSNIQEVPANLNNIKHISNDINTINEMKDKIIFPELKTEHNNTLSSSNVINYDINAHILNQNKESRVKSSDKLMFNRYTKRPQINKYGISNNNNNGNESPSTSAFTNSTKKNNLNNETNTEEMSKYCCNFYSANSTSNNNVIIPLIPLRRPNSNFNFGGNQLWDKSTTINSIASYKNKDPVLPKNFIKNINEEINNIASSTNNIPNLGGNKITSNNSGNGSLGGSSYDKFNEHMALTLQENMNIKRCKIVSPSSLNMKNQFKAGTRNKSVQQKSKGSSLEGEINTLLLKNYNNIDKMMMAKLHKIKIEKGMMGSRFADNINKRLFEVPKKPIREIGTSYPNLRPVKNK